MKKTIWLVQNELYFDFPKLFNSITKLKIR